MLPHLQSSIPNIPRFFIALLIVTSTSSACQRDILISHPLAANPFELPPEEQKQSAISSLKIIGAIHSDNGQPATCGGGSCHGGAVSKSTFLNWSLATRKIWDRCFDNQKSLNAPTGKDLNISQIECIKERRTSIGIIRAGMMTTTMRKRYQLAYPEDNTLRNWIQDTKLISMPPFGHTGSNPNGMANGPSTQDARHVLTDSEFKILWRWVMAGTPLIDTYWKSLPDFNVGECVEKIDDQLKAQIRKSLKNNWMKKLVRNDVDFTPFGCGNSNVFKQQWTLSPAQTPIDLCFHQKNDDSKNIFPESPKQSFSWYPAPSRKIPNGWIKLPSKLRVLGILPGRTGYWTRSSADGRFVGSGGNSRLEAIGGCPANTNAILDLQSSLDPNFSRRVISVNAEYDPGFFPNNQGLTWIARERGTKIDAMFCSQDILQNQNTTCINARNPDKLFKDSCSLTNLKGTYQHVGAKLDGKKMLVVRGVYTNDDGGNSAKEDPDTSKFLTSTDNSRKSRFYISSVEPNRSCRPDTSRCDPYVFGKRTEIVVSGEGDFTVSPSSSLIGSRIATSSGGKIHQKGYSIRRLVPIRQGYSANSVGNICINGGKASFSFNDRFLAVHHYPSDLSPADRLELNVSQDDYREKYLKNTSNVYITDLCTGNKTRVTKMLPGQFALYPHFRADGWLYFTVRDVRPREINRSYIVASDVALRMQLRDPGCG